MRFRFGQLQALDVSGVPPAVRIDVGEENVLRADSAVDYDARYTALGPCSFKQKPGKVDVSLAHVHLGPHLQVDQCCVCGAGRHC